jgi:hypothetical protein
MQDPMQSRRGATRRGRTATFVTFLANNTDLAVRYRERLSCRSSPLSGNRG